VEAGNRHRDDGQGHERDEDGDVDPDGSVDVTLRGRFVMSDAAYRR
jgi:hypothetical protein